MRGQFQYLFRKERWKSAWNGIPAAHTAFCPQEKLYLRRRGASMNKERLLYFHHRDILGGHTAFVHHYIPDLRHLCRRERLACRHHGQVCPPCL